jgi:serine protease Do
MCMLMVAAVLAGPVGAHDLAVAAPTYAVGFTPDYRAIAQRAGPAVVAILVEGLRPPSFFTERSSPSPGLGSGFLITPDGLVLTSAHVIEGGRRITVRLRDRREFSARVVGSDTVTDVAVLRIEGTDLPFLRAGSVDLLQAGDAVVAIGAPFGLEQSVSHGILSAKGRALPGMSAVPHIQTDAPINPGHSGGPLLDAAGAVIGMHAQIYSSSGGYQGLSFAVPIDVALKVKDHLVAHGRMAHGYLGVTIQSLSPTLASAFGIAGSQGALVGGVDAGSAAESAGLRAGDIITHVQGVPVGRAAELFAHLGPTVPGERVRLSLWRGRQTRELVVRLGEAMDAGATGDPAESVLPEVPQELGWRLRPLTPQERVSLGTEGGLWIDGVSALSAQAGLRTGDVLLSINLKPVTTVEGVQKLMREGPSRFALLVDRDGLRLFVAISLDGS